MFFVNDERAAALLASSNTVSNRCVDLSDAQETKPHAFSARPKVFLAASALRFRPALFLPVARGVAGLRASRSERQPRKAPYGMVYSCPATYVCRDHVNAPVPQLEADLPASLTIKAPI